MKKILFLLDLIYFVVFTGPLTLSQFTNLGELKLIYDFQKQVETFLLGRYSLVFTLGYLISLFALSFALKKKGKLDRATLTLSFINLLLCSPILYKVLIFYL